MRRRGPPHQREGEPVPARRWVPLLRIAVSLRVLLAPLARRFGCAARRAPRARTASGLTTGIVEPGFRSSADRDGLLDMTMRANAGIVRIGVTWSSVAPSRPANPRNPSDPAYRFSTTDAAIRAAAAAGVPGAARSRTRQRGRRDQTGRRMPAPAAGTRIPVRFSATSEPRWQRYCGRLSQPGWPGHSSQGAVLQGLERTQPEQLHHPRWKATRPAAPRSTAIC